MIKELGMGIVLVAASGCANSAGEKEAAGVPVVSESQPGAVTTTTVIPLEEPMTTTTEAPAPTTTAPAPTTTHTHAPRPTVTYPPTTAPPAFLDYGEWAIPRYIVMCESGGDWNAINSSGASGPYQLMPIHFGGELAMYQSRAAQHAKAAELWDDGRGRSHWAACL